LLVEGYDNPQTKVVNSGNVISIGSRRWTEMLNMSLGLRLACEMLGELKREVKKEDFSVKVSFELPQTKKDEISTFVDFAPQVFAKLRKLFGVTKDEYMVWKKENVNDHSYRLVQNKSLEIC
jgi:hypothetical protein